MFIREVTAKSSAGRRMTYVQLVHNERDPKTGYSRAKVLYGFGRKDALDMKALKRLVHSISRFLGPEDALQAQAMAKQGKGALKFMWSREFGGGYALQKVWEELEIGEEIQKLLKARGKEKGEIERSIFAMVANRALAPMSKLSIERWSAEAVRLPGKEGVSASGLYRGMDFLKRSQKELEERVFFRVASLMNLEVDVLFFDTSSTYFEIEEEDDEGEGIRHYGYSRDQRGDLPQVLIGMAVTREGMPVKTWVWPGEASDRDVVTEVKRDLTAWRLGRVLWAMDRGMVSEDNAIRLQEAGHHFILGERLGTKTAQEALERGGKYERIADGLLAKEAVVGRGEKRKRYVVVYSRERQERDRHVRENILNRVRAELKRIGDLKGKTHTKAACALVGHRILGRYVKTLKRGQLRLDRKRIGESAKRDGKYVLWTSDDTLSIRDVVMGYKKLSEVERAWRDLKHRIDLRPVYHRKEERIRAHVLLCWLALLLIRTMEIRTGRTWFRILPLLRAIHVGRFEGKAGVTMQTTELSSEQARLFRELKIPTPPHYLEITRASNRTSKE